jgi:hypothetical protein
MDRLDPKSTRKVSLVSLTMPASVGRAASVRMAMERFVRTVPSQSGIPVHLIA